MRWAIVLRSMMSLAAWALVPADAHASDELGGCGYRALMFGVEQYKSDEWQDLESPVRDVKLLGQTLKEQYGFEVSIVSNPTRQGILDALEEMQAEVEPCESVVVYYAGHGERDDAMDTGFWLPSDATRSKSTWISNGDVADRLRALPVQHVLLIVDSCFAGTLVRAVDLVRRGGDDASGPMRLASARSRMVFTSGGVESVVDTYRDTGNSTFAFFLQQTLMNARARYVTFSEVFPEVRALVMQNVPQQPRFGALYGVQHEGGTLVLINHESVGEASLALERREPPTRRWNPWLMGGGLVVAGAGAAMATDSGLWLLSNRDIFTVTANGILPDTVEDGSRFSARRLESIIGYGLVAVGSVGVSAGAARIWLGPAGVGVTWSVAPSEWRARVGESRRGR